MLQFGDEGVPTQINTTSASLIAGEHLGGRVQSSRVDSTPHELIEARLCHRRDPTRHGRDLLDIDIDRPDVVRCLGEARGGHRAYDIRVRTLRPSSRQVLPSSPHEARARVADTEVARGGMSSEAATARSRMYGEASPRPVSVYDAMAQ